jgi:two-component system NtrC family sensor kinase
MIPTQPLLAGPNQPKIPDGMKLTAKIVSLWMTGTLIVVAAGSFFAVRRDAESAHEHMRQDAAEIGGTLAPLIQDAWRTSGEQRALQLIADANRENRQLNVGWVWIDRRPAGGSVPKLSAGDLQNLHSGNPVFVEERHPSGGGFLHTYVPVPIPAVSTPVVSTPGSGLQTGAIELTNSLDRLDQITHQAIVRIVELGAVLVILSALAAACLGVWLVGRPLSRLIDKTRSAGRGELSNPLHLTGHDELAELGFALNLSCNQLAAARERLRMETQARIAALEQLRHADRLKTVGRLAGGIAHELGTPMNVVLARAELIGLEGASETSVASAQIIKAQIQRMATMIRQLLDFGRRGRAHKEARNLVELCERTIQLVEPLAKGHNVALELREPGSPVHCEIDSPQIQQVLTNLIENAVHAMPQGGTVTLHVEAGPFQSLSERPAEGNAHARLVVEDHGIGISAENLAHIFDPFFTTKDVGKGTGLGLSIAYGIVQDHGGWIEVRSTPGEGSHFFVYLPLMGAHSANTKCNSASAEAAVPQATSSI